MSSRGSGGRSNGTLPQTKICQFKLVLLGDMAVGKSSLVLRFVKGQFDEFQETTIGAAFLAQSVCLDDTTVKFEIWDTAGQERYHSLAPMYYRGAQAAIVVFDITKPAWVKELQRQASPNIVIALAGNKADLAERRLVEYEEAQTYAEDTGLLFMETSAKTAMNVNELFLAIGDQKDAKNRHPKPYTCSAASGSQPPGPRRPLHSSLLRGELDRQRPTSSPPSTPPQPFNHPVSFSQVMGGGPDAGEPPLPTLHSSSCPSRQKFKKEKMKKGKEKQTKLEKKPTMFHTSVSLSTSDSLRFGKYERRRRTENERRKILKRVEDIGKPVSLRPLALPPEWIRSCCALCHMLNPWNDPM
ncbi:hypothetical protein FQN60_018554, partial [Etheostoma spectabile]